MKIHTTKKKNLFYIFTFIFIFLIPNIKCYRRRSRRKSEPFHGVYRIDTVSNNLVLTYKEGYLYLSTKNFMDNHF